MSQKDSLLGLSQLKLELSLATINVNCYLYKERLPGRGGI